MIPIIRESSRLEYAFSTMFNSNGVIGHELTVCESSMIDEALKVLQIPSNQVNRYIAARKLSESDITFRFNQKGLDCTIISSVGSLIPISPSILNPFRN